MDPDVRYYKAVAFIVSSSGSPDPAGKITCRAALIMESALLGASPTPGLLKLRPDVLLDRFVLKYNRGGFERTADSPDIFAAWTNDVVMKMWRDARVWLDRKCVRMKKEPATSQNIITVSIGLLNAEMKPTFPEDVFRITFG